MECEIPTWYQHSEPIARKTLRCIECGATIHKGEQHFAFRGKWSDRFFSGRQHLACMKACMWFRDQNDGECIGFGDLLNAWRDMRWQYDRHGRDKTNPAWVEIRKLMAEILWRKRKDSE